MNSKDSALFANSVLDWNPLKLRAIPSQTFANQARLGPFLGRFELTGGSSIEIFLPTERFSAVCNVDVSVGLEVVSVDLSAEFLEFLVSQYVTFADFFILPSALKISVLNAALRENRDSSLAGDFIIVERFEDLSNNGNENSKNYKTEAKKNGVILAFSTENFRASVMFYPEVEEHFSILESIAKLGHSLKGWNSLPIRCPLLVGCAHLDRIDVLGLESDDVFFFADSSFSSDTSRVFLEVGNTRHIVELVSSKEIKMVKLGDTTGNLSSQDASNTSGILLDVCVEAGVINIPLEKLGLLAEGMVLDLERGVEEPLLIKINGFQVGTCRLVELNGRIGAQILSSLNTKESGSVARQFITNLNQRSSNSEDYSEEDDGSEVMDTLNLEEHTPEDSDSHEISDTEADCENRDIEAATVEESGDE